MRLAIIIPAFNEESAIKSVLLSLPKKITGVRKIVSIVVDDGSGDNTYAEAKKMADFTLKHVVNLGQGAAFSTGFKLAKKLGCDMAVTIDGDGQHSPKDIANLIKPIVLGEADFVNGSRMFKTKGMPKFKVYGNKIMNLITFLIYGIWVSDSQSGARALSRDALQKISLRTSGHEVCSEMIGEAKRNKLKIIEIPIQTIYTDYSIKKGQLWLNGINIFTRLLTIRLIGK